MGRRENGGYKGGGGTRRRKEGMGSEGGEEQVRAEPKIKEANVKRESKRERRRICRNYEGEESDGESRQAEDGGKGEETGGWRGRERKGRAKAEAGEREDKEEMENEG